MTLLGWRHTWLAIGIGLAIVLVPLALWLLRSHAERERRRRGEFDDEARRGEGHWAVREVLRDIHFYRVLPAVVLTPFTVTGLFFHQAALAAGKGWSLGWFATAFVAYAVA